MRIVQVAGGMSSGDSKLMPKFARLHEEPLTIWTLYKGLYGEWNKVNLKRYIFRNMNILHIRLMKLISCVSFVICGDLCCLWAFFAMKGITVMAKKA